MRSVLQLVLGEQSCLDALGQLDLLLGRQQAPSPDGLQVGVDRVAHHRSLVVQVVLLGAAAGADHGRGARDELGVGIAAIGGQF